MDAREFILAAYKGDQTIIRKYLAKGFNPNTREDDGTLALTAAASRGHTPIVKMLLESGANINHKHSLHSALGYAAASKNLEMLKDILSCQQQIKQEVLDEALDSAALNGNADIVTLLVQHGADPNCRSWSSNSLARTVARGKVEVVQTLLQLGANPNLNDSSGRNTLMLVANGRTNWHLGESGSTVDAIKLLLREGANPNVCDAEGYSVLTRAAATGCTTVVTALYEFGSNINQIDKAKRTALEATLDNGDIKMIEMLLSYGIDCNSIGTDGQTPLTRSITSRNFGKKKLVELLLHYGADASARDKQGFSAYERACQFKLREIIPLLEGTSPNLFPEITATTSKQEGVVSKPRKANGTYSPNERIEKNAQEDVMKELNKLIGLDNVKVEVQSLVNFLHIQQLRKAKGLSSPEQSLHMVFTGNPGTGKTTIARLIAQIYRNLGILSKGQFVETDRSGLVGGYLGQTAIKTQEIVRSAVGGILFIDEAYNLTDDEHGRDMYGQEAVATLLKLMEDKRDDLVVIAAGYTESMQKFIRSNPGLQSRFNKFLHFDDYSPFELIEIFKHFAAQSDYRLSAATELKLGNVFTNLYQSRDETFGNARLARNLFEKSINDHASRMITAGALDKESLITLQPEDIPSE